MVSDGKKPAGTLARCSTGYSRIAKVPTQADIHDTSSSSDLNSVPRHIPVKLIDALGPWMDCNRTSDRGNDLLRATWQLIDEAVCVVNRAGAIDELLVAELFEEASDIERKISEARSAETVEALRSWRAHAESRVAKVGAGNVE